MSSAVEQLLKAARFIEMQELRQKHQYKVDIPGCTPPDSPVTTGNHYTIHNLDYTNINSAIVRIDGRTDQPFLSEHTVVAPPLVVITSTQNNPTHSLSPHSFDASRSRSSSISSSNPITVNGVHHVLAANGEDSSQSSLNLSSTSSGYSSGGGSANSSSSGGSIGSCSSNGSNSSGGNGNSLNLNGPTTITTVTSAGAVTGNGTLTTLNGSSPDFHHHHNQQQQQQQQQQHHQQEQHSNITSAGSLTSSQLPQVTTSRRRTISSNSNGGTQRSPCILRADTREVHNKLEKNRRAHLKDCFEQLKKELPYQEEKKTSNLSILGNAYKTVQSLKLKERELEHEMERLAKEKVAQQKRIVILKRELSAQFDHSDTSFLLPENDGIIGGVRERFLSESLSEHSLPSSGRARYSSTSSLSSAATASSPCAAGIPTQSAMTSIASASNSPSSPQRPNSSSPTTTIPLSLISVMDSQQPALKITQVVSNALTNGITHNANHIAINFTTSEAIPPTLLTATTAPMSLNLNGSHHTNSLGHGLQIISTPANGTAGNGKLLSTNGIGKSGKNGIRSTAMVDASSVVNAHNLIGTNIKDGVKMELMTPGKIDSSEPPAKVIKLINTSSIALASVVDKDSKLLSSNSLTLSQVVVSPLPLRVNGQTSNSLATIELSNSNVQRTTNNPTNGTQLHKLLVNGTSGNLTSGNSVLTTTSTSIAPELARLPGGAELNILPAGTNGTSLYRSNGKLTAIVNNGFTFKDFIGTDSNGTNGRAVHMVTPVQSNTTPISGLTPIVVSQGQNGANLTHIIASSPQLAGKVVTTPLSVNGQGLPIMGTQYLSTTMVKPMVVTVAGTGSATAVQNGAITLPITTSTTANGGSS